MNFIQHPSNNDVLLPPPSATPEECRPLFITRQVVDGCHAVTSFWQPSAAQIALINAGKPVYLQVLGRTHPPLLLGVDGDGYLAGQS